MLRATKAAAKNQQAGTVEITITTTELISRPMYPVIVAAVRYRSRPAIFFRCFMEMPSLCNAVVIRAAFAAPSCALLLKLLGVIGNGTGQPDNRRCGMCSLDGCQNAGDRRKPGRDIISRNRGGLLCFGGFQSGAAGNPFLQGAFQFRSSCLFRFQLCGKLPGFLLCCISFGFQLFGCFLPLGNA